MNKEYEFDCLEADNFFDSTLPSMTKISRLVDPKFCDWLEERRKESENDPEIQRRIVKLAK